MKPYETHQPVSRTPFIPRSFQVGPKMQPVARVIGHDDDREQKNSIIRVLEYDKKNIAGYCSSTVISCNQH